MKHENNYGCDYLLFGKQACSIYEEFGFEKLDELIGTENIAHSSYAYLNGSSINQLLWAFRGWDEYTYISKEEYNKLNDVGRYKFHNDSNSFQMTHYKPVEGKPGYMTFEKHCTYRELQFQISCALIRAKSPHHLKNTLYDLLEYLSISVAYDNYDMNIPRFVKIFCYPVIGKSEGAYFYINSVDLLGVTHNLILGKTLMENTKHIHEINKEINEFLITNHN
jgi:hypothetical protein